MYQHQTDASALKTCSQSLPYYFGFVMCGGRALFAFAGALQELSHDQVSLFSTAKARAQSRAAAPLSRDSALGHRVPPQGDTLVPGRCQPGLAQAQCGHRVLLTFTWVLNTISSFNSSFRGFLFIFSTPPFCIG